MRRAICVLAMVALEDIVLPACAISTFAAQDAWRPCNLKQLHTSSFSKIEFSEGAAQTVYTDLGLSEQMAGDYGVIYAHFRRHEQKPGSVTGSLAFLFQPAGATALRSLILEATATQIPAVADVPPAVMVSLTRSEGGANAGATGAAEYQIAHCPVKWTKVSSSRSQYVNTALVFVKKNGTSGFVLADNEDILATAQAHLQRLLVPPALIWPLCEFDDLRDGVFGAVKGTDKSGPVWSWAFGLPRWLPSHFKNLTTVLTDTHQKNVFPRLRLTFQSTSDVLPSGTFYADYEMRMNLIPDVENASESHIAVRFVLKEYDFGKFQGTDVLGLHFDSPYTDTIGNQPAKKPLILRHCPFTEASVPGDHTGNGDATFIQHSQVARGLVFTTQDKKNMEAFYVARSVGNDQQEASRNMARLLRT